MLIYYIRLYKVFFCDSHDYNMAIKCAVEIFLKTNDCFFSHRSINHRRPPPFFFHAITLAPSGATIEYASLTEPEGWRKTLSPPYLILEYALNYAWNEYASTASIVLTCDEDNVPQSFQILHIEGEGHCSGCTGQQRCVIGFSERRHLNICKTGN